VFWGHIAERKKHYSTYKDETRIANSLKMHYITVGAGCNIVHPEAICSPHGLQIAFSIS